MAKRKRSKPRAARPVPPTDKVPLDGPTRDTGPRPTVMIALTAGVALCVLITHWPALSARALAFDDDKHIFNSPLVQNPGLTSAGRIVGEVLQPSVGGYYKPLSMLSLMLDRAIAGTPDNLRPFRRTSLTLHLVGTILVVILLYQLFGQRWVAALAGLLYGLHPCTVEAIPWTAERKALLSAFFSLLCLVLYVRYAKRRGWGFYAAALIAYLCALLSKPTATPVVALLLLLDYWPIRRLTWRAVFEKVPFFIVGAVSAVITVISQHRTLGVASPGEESPLRAPLVLTHNIIFYLRKVVWPGAMTPHYPYPHPFDFSNALLIACLIGSVVLIAALLISWRWTRPPLVGWLFWFVAIFPAIGVVGFMKAIAADRFQYVPAVGFLLILTWALCRLWTRSTDGARTANPLARRVAIVTVVVILAVAEARATRNYLTYWQDTERLARRMVELAPDVSVVRGHLAYALGAAGEIEPAIAEYNEAIRLSPTNTQARYNLAVLLERQGRGDEAAAQYAEAIRFNPADDKSLTNLGNTLLHEGKVDQAILHYRAALKANPDLIEARNNLAAVLAGRGQLAEAAENYNALLRLQPSNVRAITALGKVLAEQGDVDGAVDLFDRALRFNPAHADALFNLGRVREKQGKTNAATARYEETLRLDPRHVEARLALVGVLADSGQLQQAVPHLQEAIRQWPRSARVAYEQGRMELRLGRPANAVQAFDRAVKLNPKYIDARIELGKATRATGDVEGAIQAFREAVRVAPDNADAHFHLGLLLHDRGDLDEAIRQYREALRLNPNHAGAPEALDMALQQSHEG